VNPIDAARRFFGVGVIGGPTVVIDYGATRLVTDPTFDDRATTERWRN
jgi:L-ascorbate metabolism protein UlaG (beta-lactamase superfamily)